MFVRVKDPDSGHQFDRPENDPLIEQGLLIPLNSKRWPPSEIERPPLHHIPKSPAADRSDQSAPEPSAPQDATEPKE
jgi:hypothetical protein